jgi:putative hydrolase of the HAD superfamily
LYFCDLCVLSRPNSFRLVRVGSSNLESRIKYVICDFGGVIADEGFYNGLHALGKKDGLDAECFFKQVESLIVETGYLTGHAGEAAFWNAVRAETGISGTDDELRRVIIDGFSLRPEMLAITDKLRAQRLTVAMLSDQTNWLEEIDAARGLYRHFDRVFNSYRIHKSKRDATVFRDVCAALNAAPEKSLFIDDNSGHVERAQQEGLRTIHFVSIEQMKRDLEQELAMVL